MKKRTQRITLISLQAVLLLTLFFPVHLIAQGSTGLLNVFGMVQWYVGTPFYIVAYMSTLVACILPLAVIFTVFRAEEDQVFTIGMVCNGLYTALIIAFYCLARSQGAVGTMDLATGILIAAAVVSFLLCLVWRKAVVFQMDEMPLHKQAT